ASAETAAPRNGGIAYYAAAARVSQDRAGCIHALTGWQTAFAHRDSEIPKAIGATPPTAATSSPAQAWACRQSSGCCRGSGGDRRPRHWPKEGKRCCRQSSCCRGARSEEHTSELQSRENIVCRLLLE